MLHGFPDRILSRVSCGVWFFWRLPLAGLDGVAAAQAQQDRVHHRHGRRRASARRPATTAPLSVWTSRCWKPRAPSPLVSDTTIARYGITGVNDLTAITPSAYTASYYGVEGAVNLRGTLGGNLFPGLQAGGKSRHLYHAAGRCRRDRDLARAAFADLWRGQSGRAGQFPAQERCGARRHAGRRSRRPPMAAIPSATPRPVQCAARFWAVPSGGVHAYGEIDDSFSFYRGIHPSHQLLELTGRLRRRTRGPSPPITCITIPTAMCRRRAGTG